MRLKNPIRDVRTIKVLLEGAEAEANRAGETMPGAEHLMLAALDLPDGTARRAFERIGADPGALRQAIEDQHAEALRAVGIDAAGTELAGSVAPPTNGVYGMRGSGRRAFDAAGRLARKTRAQLVGAHVLLAITDMEHGTAIRAVRSLGVDVHALAAAAREEARM
jgi:ATP-dependent Clp protease ATP-binding subunit ClpA